MKYNLHYESPDTIKLQVDDSYQRQNLSSGFPSRFDKNRVVQSQRMVRGLNFGFMKGNSTIYVAKTKALLSTCILFPFDYNSCKTVSPRFLVCLYV